MTEKIGFLYPGQGSQAGTMGLEFNDAERFPLTAGVFKALDELSRDVVGKSVLAGLRSPETLVGTQDVQSALLVSSLAITAALAERAIKPDVVAGHSFGMISVCVAAGTLSDEDGLRLAFERGRLMGSASSESGKMVAIIGRPREEVESLIGGTNVVVACHNAAEQTVISGLASDVDALLPTFGRSAIPLQVSIAGHHPLMKIIQPEYAEVVERMPFQDPEIPVVLDISGEITTKAIELRRALVDQLAQPVEWVACMAALRQFGVQTVIEPGARPVLSRLMKEAYPDVDSFLVNNVESLTRAAAKLATPD